MVCGNRLFIGVNEVVPFTEVTLEDGDDEGEHEEQSEDRIEREIHVQEPFTTRPRGITAVPITVQLGQSGRRRGRRSSCSSV